MPALIGIVFVFSVAYSVLTIGRLLPGLGLVIPLVVLYLPWRLVRAATIHLIFVAAGTVVCLPASASTDGG